MRNVELLQQTMQHIIDHPEQHDQGRWICGTAACFAGRAALLSGLSATEVAWIIMCRNFHIEMAELLGLDNLESLTLFHVDNSREMLELMVKDLVNGDRMRPALQYRAEVYHA